MSERAFKFGDIVKLTSDGRRMTVSAITTDSGVTQYICSWFDKNDKERLGKFPLEALMPVEQLRNDQLSFNSRRKS